MAATKSSCAGYRCSCLSQRVVSFLICSWIYRSNRSPMNTTGWVLIGKVCNSIYCSRFSFLDEANFHVLLHTAQVSHWQMPNSYDFHVKAFFVTPYQQNVQELRKRITRVLHSILHLTVLTYVKKFAKNEVWVQYHSHCNTVICSCLLNSVFIHVSSECAHKFHTGRYMIQLIQHL